MNFFCVLSLFQTPTFINRELVERGYAMWCEGEEDKPSASDEKFGVAGDDDEDLVEEKETKHEQ